MYSINPSYNKLFDKRNEQLWRQLSEDNDIGLTKSYEPNYILNSYQGSFTIYIDENKIDPAYFTHELLHIYLKNKGVKIAEEYHNLIVTGNRIRQSLFSNPLLEHIGNCLEHVKMLPIYLHLGFEPEKFNSDYHDKKMDEDFMRILESRFKSNERFELVAVDAFIGKFFGMVACNNTSHNYALYYERLKRLDLQLYTLLQNFWDNWLIYNFNNPDHSYLPILESHLTDLLGWCKQKTFF